MPVMLVASLALWFIGGLSDILWLVPREEALTETLAVKTVSLLVFFATAYLLNSLRLFERRVNWLIPLFLWLIAIFCNHDDAIAAFSTLMVMVAVAILFSSQQLEVAECRVYTSFAITTSLSFIVPLCLWILPPMLFFLLVSGIFTVKRMFAMLLGMVTPYWLVYGTVYIYPEADICTRFLHEFVASHAMFASEMPITGLLKIVVELLLLLPASVAFMTSSSPAKPMLRKRLLFFLCLNIYLIILSFAYPLQDVLFIWRIPGMSIVAAYMFSLKITRVSNVYFIFMNLIWLLMAVFNVWSK